MPGRTGRALCPEGGPLQPSHGGRHADEVGDFFLDVFNTGFQTDSFKIRILEQPDDWQYRLYDNDTGLELVEEGIYSLTPDIGSTQILTMRLHRRQAD